MNLKIISAGAGSGKTYRLTQELSSLLAQGQVEARSVMATTFTKKAAAELLERVQASLMSEKRFEEAEELEFAMIGTVHAVAQQLLKRFALEAGISPQVNTLAEEDSQRIFNKSIAQILNLKIIGQMNDLYFRLGMSDDKKDWRSLIFKLANDARVNKFTPEDLQASASYSVQTYFELLPPTVQRDFETELATLIQVTVDNLEANQADATKATKNTIGKLRSFAYRLLKKETFPWKEYAQLMSLTVSVKSKDILAPLLEFIASHEELPAFQKDIQNFIETLLSLVSQSMREFQQYKQERGLIDFVDMEVLISTLLDNPVVQQAIQEDIKVLMVDEFQDTNPIQLEIFWKLTQLVDQAIWVGDPKQSIYGFRGAEPALMQALIEQTGGLNPENIQDTSYRSRQDLVAFANGIFVKAFPNLRTEQIVLKHHRTDDVPNIQPALQHWHFKDANPKSRFSNQWMYQSIAWQVKNVLESPPVFRAKNGQIKAVEPGDIAILCRTNAACMNLADALNEMNIPASCARTGLLETFECKVLLSTLRFLVNPNDTLAIAEICHFLEEKPLEEVLENRQKNLETEARGWKVEGPVFEILQEIRNTISIQSPREVLAQTIEKTNITTLLMRLSAYQQRLDNIEVLKKCALNYEDHCERRRAPATLGGLIQYLEALGIEQKDLQAVQPTGAVQVLTYHKSKGLEWPFVVLSDLWSNMKAYPWGQKIESAAELRLDDILGGRKMLFWPNPYDRAWQKTNLGKRIEEQVMPQVSARELEEKARLMYVGITRARDYLVIPTSDKSMPKVLNAIYLGDEKAEFLAPQSNEIQFEWEQTTLQKETTLLTTPEEFEVLQSQPMETEMWQKSIRKEVYKPLFSEQFGKAASPKIFEHLRLSPSTLGYEYNYLMQLTPLLTHFVRNRLITGNPSNLDDITATCKRASTWQPNHEQIKTFEDAYINLLQDAIGGTQFSQVDLIVNKSKNGQLGRFKIDIILETASGYWAFIFMQTSEIGNSKRLLNRLATLKGSCQGSLQNTLSKPVFYGALGISNEEIFVEKAN